MPQSELYVSVDVEADGRIPGRSSMLSFGAAAFTLEKELVAVHGVNLETLPEATPDPEVMAWWGKQPEAWAACRRDLRDPAAAMPEFAALLKDWRGRFGPPVFMGFPAAYDFGWINWYLHAFAGGNPFGISGLCLKSYGAALLGVGFRRATKRNFPRRWFEDLRHTHVALDDAVEQGAMGINMLREGRKLPPVDGIRNRTDHVLSQARKG
jgi:hypothetical protein